MNVQRLHIVHKETTLVDIQFSIEHALALVGESGSGKTLTLKSLLGILPKEMQLSLEYEAPFELTRGTNVAFVPQNPFTSLSPLTKLKDHFMVNEARQKELVDLVGLDSDLLNRYPPELSGGQLQRFVIIIALENAPKLLLLDEPTTALDPQSKSVIIELLKYLQEEMGFKILLVTHDFESAKGLCDSIAVIQSGQIVESGKLFAIINQPKEAYTKKLIEANFSNRDFRA